MHKLLTRQLRRASGLEGEALEAALAELMLRGAAAGAALSPAAQRLRDALPAALMAVDEAYAQADRDLELRSRSLELSSRELGEANERMRAELASRERAADSLRGAMKEMLDRTGSLSTATLRRAAIPAAAFAKGDNLESLATLMMQTLR